MIPFSFEGKMTIQLGTHSFEVVGSCNVVEVRFSSLASLKEVYDYMKGSGDLLTSWVPKALQSLEGVELRVMVRDLIIARAGLHATPNALAQSFGLEGFELLPAAAMAAWRHG